MHELVGGARLLQVGEVGALHPLLPHPEIARVEGEVVAGGAGADHDHAALLHHEDRDRERRLARVLEDDVDVALAGDVPDRLAEARASLSHSSYSGVPTFGICAPALELLAVDHALGAELSTYSRLYSSEMTPMALAPEAATSCTPNTPRPPEAPQTSTLSPGLSACGGWPNSMR